MSEDDSSSSSGHGHTSMRYLKILEGGRKGGEERREQVEGRGEERGGNNVAVTHNQIHKRLLLPTSLSSMNSSQSDWAVGRRPMLLTLYRPSPTAITLPRRYTIFWKRACSPLSFRNTVRSEDMCSHKAVMTVLSNVRYYRCHYSSSAG